MIKTLILTPIYINIVYMLDKNILKTNTPYLQTGLLLEIFRDYSSPRDKLKNLVKKNNLINVVQGLYVPGPDYNKAYSKEVLAGIIFGPSALTFEYALSYHGLIPERVERITSLCFKRDKLFNTPLGCFSYKYIAQKKFSIGLEYVQTSLGNFIIASPEKAILDMAYFEAIQGEDDAYIYLTKNLRIEEKSLRELDHQKLEDIQEVYSKKSTFYVLRVIKELIRQNGENK